jgi:DNA-binding LytR/AlgR family response regulator
LVTLRSALPMPATPRRPCRRRDPEPSAAQPHERMPRCLIAEDEPLLAAGLRRPGRAVARTAVAAVVGDGLSAVTQTLALRPQICFFDIRMPGCTGLEAAQALAEDWPDGADAPPFPLLVFVTAYDDYALQAFEAQAVDYLVKPVDRTRLAACLTRLRTRLGPACCRQRWHHSPSAPGTALQQTLVQLRALLGAVPGTAAGGAGTAPRLAVVQAQVGNLVHLVPVEEVLYFEAADKYVRVITADREHLIRTSLRSCCRSWTRRPSGRCTAARWCRPRPSPARGAKSRARSRSRCGPRRQAHRQPPVRASVQGHVKAARWQVAPGRAAAYNRGLSAAAYLRLSPRRGAARESPCLCRPPPPLPPPPPPAQDPPALERELAGLCSCRP